MDTKSMFNPDALDRIMSETLPADARPGEKVVVATVDNNGVKVAAVFKLRDQWSLEAVGQMDWKGRKSAGARVIMRWE